MWCDLSISFGTLSSCWYSDIYPIGCTKLHFHINWSALYESLICSIFSAENNWYPSIKLYEFKLSFLFFVALSTVKHSNKYQSITNSHALHPMRELWVTEFLRISLHQTRYILQEIRRRGHSVFPHRYSIVDATKTTECNIKVKDH